MKVWEVRNNRLNLRDVESPRPARAETAVQVQHTGICGSDLPKLRNPARFSLPQPWRPGHEIVGADSMGRTVAVDPLVSCHTCRPCLEGDSHLCPNLQRLGWDLPGGFAEQVLVPSSNIHPLPTPLDPLHAVLADPAAVAIHGLRCTPIKPPGRLAVIGAGTVGLLTALGAHQGGWQVTVIHRDGRAPSAAIAAAIPGDLHATSTVGEHAFNVVVDAASGADSAPLALALRLVHDGGTIVVQNAYHPGVTLPVPLRDVFGRSLRLVGCFSHCRHPPGDFPLALTLLNQNAEALPPLIAQAGHLSDLNGIITRRGTSASRLVLTNTSNH